MNINQGLNFIKTMIEDAIIENGEAGKKSVINSSRTINILHEVVKSDLIKAGVNPDLIKPALGLTNQEIQLLFSAFFCNTRVTHCKSITG
jgi:hypothetical protein